MIERKPLLECYKSSVFKSVDQAWQQIIAFDLQKKMVVIRSLGKKGIVTLMQNVMYKVSTVPSALRCET